MSNLVNHARTELSRIGEDADTIAGIVSVVQAFADMGHSGFSAHATAGYLERLLRFEPLSPLTNDPAEWQEHPADIAGPEWRWQNCRDSRAFSRDGGKTYRFVDYPGDLDAAPVYTAEPAKS